MTNNMETRQIIISGKVQAVGVRNWVKKTRENLSLGGNVRNTVDMKVEAMITGHKFNLDQFCWLCRRGPLLAKVEDVKIKCVDLEEFGSFNIIYQ
jgi:acylphosphatase